MALGWARRQQGDLGLGNTKDKVTHGAPRAGLLRGGEFEGQTQE